MRALPLIAAATLIATTAAAGDKRQMEAHEHGHGTLDIAVEGNTVQMALQVPGADIVGFEHAATTDADKAAMDAATAKLMQPLALFVPPPAAGCSVTTAEVAFETEDHDHDKAAGQAEKEHKGEEERHGEFHATYALTCATPATLTQIEFAYFAAFPAAEELDVQVISEKGQGGYEVTRDAPVLTLGGMI